jgi:catechol 2,3-dioxygenase-like lactoylglutathione lyase family enzyme
MSSWPTGIDAITLLVEDLEAAKRFYSELFGLPVKFEDDNSVVFEFGNTLVNLLKTTAAPELIERPHLGDRTLGVASRSPAVEHQLLSGSRHSVLVSGRLGR